MIFNPRDSRVGRASPPYSTGGKMLLLFRIL
jgi:hypothetical protein